METIGVELISRETIKPSSPTPRHLRTYKLSFLDQCAPSAHIWSVFLYGAPRGEDKSLLILKQSLSKVLAHFYPLAGRIKDYMSVDCNDQGAEYIEARVNCTLSQLLQQKNVYKILRKLAPPQSAAANKTTPPLIIQTTLFECGAVALLVSVSHKLADGATVGSFVNAWASLTVSGTLPVLPELTLASSLFPQLTDRHLLQSVIYGRPPLDNTTHSSSDDGIARRYAFGSSSITALKAKSASKSVPSPSRVEAVTALICKCWTTAKLQMGILKRQSVLVWILNIRPNIVPPLSAHSFGNLLTYVVSQPLEYETTQDMGAFVQTSRTSITDLQTLSWTKHGDAELTSEKFQELRSLWARDDLNLYLVNSGCKLPLYQADFGWGKPTWFTTVPPICTPDEILLLDTADGNGIEARVNFTGEQEVTLFESNQELLQHASFHPLITRPKL